MTYLKVGKYWRYLAVVMDRYTRRILGWSYSKHRDARLTLRALSRAVRQREGSIPEVFHSDRGVEYLSYRYRQRLSRLGIEQSVNRPRRMNDNAHVESFFGSLKADWYHGQQYLSDNKLRDTVRSYMEFYNHQRLHTALGLRTPVDFEAKDAT